MSNTNETITMHESIKDIAESLNSIKSELNGIKSELKASRESTPNIIVPNGMSVQAIPLDASGKPLPSPNSMKEERKETKTEIPILSPHELKAYLDEHIIGQDDAKRRISTAVYKHFMRLAQPELENSEVHIEKSNVMVIGSSGCGKTEIARRLARKLGLPFTIFDISNVSASGYVGNDLVFCLRDLLDDAKGNLALAERGIVFIDEFNKIARHSGANRSITNDVNGEKVQGELLRMIEDGVVDVPSERGRLNPQQPMIKMNCKDILFIFSGSFEGLDKIIQRRLKTDSVGYTARKIQDEIDTDDILKYTTTEDLLEYGIMRELLSRTPIITHVKDLTVDQMKRIMVEPKNAIVKQYQKLFAMNGKNLVFEGDALDYMANYAIEKHTGARALRFIIDKVLDDKIYDIQDNQDVNVIITKTWVENALKVA